MLSFEMQCDVFDQMRDSIDRELRNTGFEDFLESHSIDTGLGRLVVARFMVYTILKHAQRTGTTKRDLDRIRKDVSRMSHYSDCKEYQQIRDRLEKEKPDPIFIPGFKLSEHFEDDAIAGLRMEPGAFMAMSAEDKERHLADLFSNLDFTDMVDQVYKETHPAWVSFEINTEPTIHRLGYDLDSVLYERDIKQLYEETGTAVIAIWDPPAW